MMMLPPRTIVLQPGTVTTGYTPFTAAGSPSELVNCQIEINYSITSDSTSKPALDLLSSWKSGSSIAIIAKNNISGLNLNPSAVPATVYGLGGSGGKGASPTNAQPGSSGQSKTGTKGYTGGTAIRCNNNIAVLISIYSNYSVSGGTGSNGGLAYAGGGGGGGSYAYLNSNGGGGGGGGQGSSSTGGAGGSGDYNGSPGAAGSLSGPGIGGLSSEGDYRGGTGGVFNTAGSASVPNQWGLNAAGGPGGVATTGAAGDRGNSIENYSFLKVIYINTLTGPTIG